MHKPALGPALKVSKDLQLCDKWHERGDGEMTKEQLADIVSCEPDLLCQYSLNVGFEECVFVRETCDRNENKGT